MGAPVISAVRTPRKWVLLTPYHLSEHVVWRFWEEWEYHRVFLTPRRLRGQMGSLWCWRRSTWLPLSMLASIHLSRRFAWWWLLLSVLNAGLAAAKFCGARVLPAVQPIVFLLISAVWALFFLIRSW
ncbi:MAG: hypothetical protein QHJ34_11210 [bacterium]|jgi:hypothetical protein|nr:hypothetical protein [candidate division KSB1 bacterium]MDH7560781.1 hypothetical protein [bacterium]